jgi:hypothetical protein
MDAQVEELTESGFLLLSSSRFPIILVIGDESTSTRAKVGYSSNFTESLFFIEPNLKFLHSGP